MKKLVTILKIVSLGVLLYYIDSELLKFQDLKHKSAKAQTEINRTWDRLVSADSVSAQAYKTAVDEHQQAHEGLDKVSLRYSFTVLIAAWLCTSLVWKFIVAPVRSWWKRKKTVDQLSSSLQ